MKASDKIEKIASKRRKYIAPEITHEDGFARTSLAACGLTPGSPAPPCGVSPSSGG